MSNYREILAQAKQENEKASEQENIQANKDESINTDNHASIQASKDESINADNHASIQASEEELVNLCVRVSKPWRTRVKAAAVNHNVSLGDLVVEAIERYMEQEKWG